jgi:hypothetical protein
LDKKFPSSIKSYNSFTLFTKSRHWNEVVEESTYTHTLHLICTVILLFPLHLNFPSGHSWQEFFMQFSCLTLPSTFLALSEHHHYLDFNVVRWRLQIMKLLIEKFLLASQCYLLIFYSASCCQPPSVCFPSLIISDWLLRNLISTVDIYLLYVYFTKSKRFLLMTVLAVWCENCTDQIKSSFLFA